MKDQVVSRNILEQPNAQQVLADLLTTAIRRVSGHFSIDSGAEPIAKAVGEDAYAFFSRHPELLDEKHIAFLAEDDITPFEVANAKGNEYYRLSQTLERYYDYIQD